MNIILYMSQPAQQKYTSVLNILMTSGKERNNIETRSDIYSAALAPSRDQGFVDRSEDLIIKETPSFLVVRPFPAPDSDIPLGDYQDGGGVTLHTGTNQAVSYTNKSYQTMPNRSEIIEIVSKRPPSGPRKSSLQTETKTSRSTSKYQRLENSLSEVNVNVIDSRSKFGTTSKSVDHSRDDLFSSTSTIISTVRADSLDTGVFGSYGKSQSEAAVLDLSLDDLIRDVTPIQAERTSPNVSGQSVDQLYAKVNKNRKKERSIEMNEFTSSSTEKSAGFTVTCTAQLKDTQSSDRNQRATDAMKHGTFRHDYVMVSSSDSDQKSQMGANEESHAD